jgi:non-lysosomal glucosylceramidase
MEHHAANIKINTSAPSSSRALVLQRAGLRSIHHKMVEHNRQAMHCGGDQEFIGQFLYLEGHEYLMYNTYDVHFYASFSLLMLWPQLELSLQRDFAAAVSCEDTFVRRMMGEGAYCARKAKDFLPHDLGSPSEEPWRCLNAYNFQDVSRWKDLGPKFVLQVYRDYKHISQRHHRLHHHDDAGADSSMTQFLQQLFPVICTIMHHMESFDTDRDGMIENSGFPDQTYDIWIATGVHAYCGGLWIAACEAMAAIATIMNASDLVERYQTIAQLARKVYIHKLWNGSYLDYDSSASYQHNSVMADMLAGQWYAHVCKLSPVITPHQALSCLRTIYRYNVLEFGGGKLLGAVNGMRPPRAADKAQVDNCCIQSREVWTGTTYALAAVMMLEASHRSTLHENITEEERNELMDMAFATARGIHDAGWQEFGYWFATPEAWFRNGNYRSMGYMRALCIWAMQFAIE